MGERAHSTCANGICACMPAAHINGATYAHMLARCIHMRSPTTSMAQFQMGFETLALEANENNVIEWHRRLLSFINGKYENVC